RPKRTGRGGDGARRGRRRRTPLRGKDQRRFTAEAQRKKSDSGSDARLSSAARRLFAPTGRRDVATGGAAARRSPPTRNPWKAGSFLDPAPKGAEESPDRAVDQSNTYCSSNSISCSRSIRSSSVLKSSFCWC